MNDAALIDAAVEAARKADAGTMPTASVLQNLRAAAATRDQTRRVKLAREAEKRTREVFGTIGAVGLQVLRIAIFALA